MAMREELKKKTGELKMLEEELNRRKQEDISPMQPLESVIPSDQYSQ